MKCIPILLLTLFIANLSAQELDVESFSIAEKHTIYSKILDEDREIFIYQPKGFWGMDEEKVEYPVIFVLDGESQFLNAVSTIDFLSSAPLGNDIMPQSIIVGIPNTNRDRDLTPHPGLIGADSSSIERTGGGPKFLDFILNEIGPYLDRKYSIGQHKTIIGHSLGGLIVLQALMTKRAHFDNYLVIDPGLGFDNQSFLDEVVDTLRNADLSNESVFLATANSLPTSMAASDVADDNSELLKLIVKGNIRFLELAKSEQWKLNLECKYYDDESHFSIPLIATNDGLRHFYRFYRFKEMINYLHPSYAGRRDLVEKLRDHYSGISTKLRYDVSPMHSYLNSWAGGLRQYGRIDLASDLYDYAIELYPFEASALNTKAYFLRDLGKKKEAIVLFEKSLKLEYDKKIEKMLDDLRK